MWDFESESKTESHSESQSCFNSEFYVVRLQLFIA